MSELRWAAGGGAARAAHSSPGVAVEQLDLAGELAAMFVVDWGAVAIEAVGDRAEGRQDRCVVRVGSDELAEDAHPLSVAWAGPAFADAPDREGAAGHAERDRGSDAEGVRWDRWRP
jgi:hypothetical protein